jgi:hypothetical protein
MTYQTFISELGFFDDPFAKTNADDEERIESYFIEPPFFNAVFGDPKNPVSSIVFAPRGNGKTALKRKIELASQRYNFLCATYNAFDICDMKLSDISLDYHLTSIIRILTIAILGTLNEKKIESLSGTDRHIIYLFTKAYLSKIDMSTLKICINSVKNFTDKAKDLWNSLLGPISVAVNAILVRFGFQAAELSKFEGSEGSLGSKINQLAEIARIAQQIGYDSIYILIDKVDETSISNTATNAYEFIKPLLSDLQLLELRGYAFKFFLWDKLLEDYQKIARPDRVKYYTIHWVPSQLVEMLSKRVIAFSNGSVLTLKQLFDKTSRFNLDNFVAIFAQGSPRTLIRICKDILDQQSELDPKSRSISTDAIYKGFENISQNISNERYNETIIRELRKTKRMNFTIKYVASSVFKISQQAAVKKVNTWEDSGAVKLIGKIQETIGARSSNHYLINDLLLAKYIFNDVSIFGFTRNKLEFCDNCGILMPRDWDLSTAYTCEGCQSEKILGPIPG